MTATAKFGPGSLVHARGREWIVLNGSTEEILYLRPAAGSEADHALICLPLEPEPVTPAKFPLPLATQLGSHDSAVLLRDALLLSMRRGAAREQLRHGVEEALAALGQGFLAHRDNQSLRAALASGTLSKEAYFQQLLRVAYRLIFLLTLEERGVLHPSASAR